MMTTSATKSIRVRGVGVLSLVVATGCIDLPSPPEDRLATGSGGSAGVGGSGVGGEGMGGAAQGGGQEGGAGGAAALPICPPNVTRNDCATITALAPGESHTCALSSDGYVRCWGDNRDGQLGDPAQPKASALSPALVSPLSQVEAIDSGFRHSCALAQGKAYCWGDNELGQLGLGDTNSRNAPTALPVDDVVAVSTRKDATCLLTADDEVLCAGELLNGQPSDSDLFDPNLVAVSGLDDFGPIGRLEVGQVAACVVREDGLAMRCWGDNGYGYVGDGTTEDRPTPVDVADTLLTPVLTASAGSGWSCTIADSAGSTSLQCWGNFTGLFGGPIIEPTMLPTVTATDLVDVGTGWSHLCFLDGAGAVRCLGNSNHAELGPAVPLFTKSTVPVFVTGGVAQLEVGWQHNCAVMLSGEVRCWGTNVMGQVAPSDWHPEILEPTVIDLDVDL